MNTFSRSVPALQFPTNNSGTFIASSSIYADVCHMSIIPISMALLSFHCHSFGFTPLLIKFHHSCVYSFLRFMELARDSHHTNTETHRHTDTLHHKKPNRMNFRLSQYDVKEEYWFSSTPVLHSPSKDRKGKYWPFPISIIGAHITVDSLRCHMNNNNNHRE